MPNALYVLPVPSTSNCVWGADQEEPERRATGHATASHALLAGCCSYRWASEGPRVVHADCDKVLWVTPAANWRLPGQIKPGTRIHAYE